MKLLDTFKFIFSGYEMEWRVVGISDDGKSIECMPIAIIENGKRRELGSLGDG